MTSETLAPQDIHVMLVHITEDIHDITQRIQRIEDKIAEYEPLAKFARSWSESAALRVLGRGRRDRA
jgi:hypothetical protein